MNSNNSSPPTLPYWQQQQQQQQQPQQQQPQPQRSQQQPTLQQQLQQQLHSNVQQQLPTLQQQQQPPSDPAQAAALAAMLQLQQQQPQSPTIQPQSPTIPNSNANATTAMLQLQQQQHPQATATIPNSTATTTTTITTTTTTLQQHSSTSNNNHHHNNNTNATTTTSPTMLAQMPTPAALASLHDDNTAAAAVGSDDASQAAASFHTAMEHATASGAQSPSDDLEQLPELRNRIRFHIDEAVHLISKADKEAYLEAKEKVPDLVRTESDPLEFVRYCGYDAWSAANRLCLYWKERKALFEDRAFLPLVLTGTGALSKEDLLTLQAGFPAFLPDSSRGQKVMLLDRRKWIPSATSKNRLRCLWFMFNLLSKNDRAQTEKDYIQLLGLHVAPRVYDADESYLERVSFYGGKVFPVYYTVNVGVVPSPRQPFAIQAIIAKGMKYIQERVESVPNIMIQREPGQLYEELQEELNLLPEGIPMDIGGQWRVDSWFQWCQERQEKEREKYQWLIWEAPNQNKDGENKRQFGRPKRTEEEKLERRRLADLLHSRRKRERKKQQLSSLQSETARLQSINTQLKAEQARLEGLLEDTDREIKKLKPGD